MISGDGSSCGHDFDCTDEKNMDEHFGIPAVPGTDRKIAILSDKSLDELVMDSYSHKSLKTKSNTKLEFEEPE